MAVPVEDHALGYADFEATIPRAMTVPAPSSSGTAATGSRTATRTPACATAG